MELVNNLLIIFGMDFARTDSVHPTRALYGARALAVAPERDALADLKLFATAWLGGLVFFGTYLS